MSVKKCNSMTFGIGAFLLGAGICLGVMWPTIFGNIFQQKLQLDPTSETHQLWIRTPIPMYLDLYLFNWTNAKDFMQNHSVIPNFVEVGPFVFKEVHDRVNVTWNDNNTVTFNQTRTWSFIPEESVNLSTNITNLNVIALTVAHMTRHYPSYETFLINKVMQFEETFFVTKSAKEWLFDGMKDKMLDIIGTLKNIIHIDIPYKKFGFFVERNLSSSYDGIFTMKTGVDDIYNLGVMDRWNHMKQTSYFEGSCALVNGTTGELFPPMPNVQLPVTAFISDICSSVSLTYAEAATVEGLSGYKYVGDQSMFDNGTLYPDKKCFCTGECTPSGVRNLTRCRYGAPVFASFPHFYLADPSYTKAMTGMRPNKTDHEFYLKLEPKTGVPVEVRAQLQINLLLQPISAYTMFEKMPKVYVPMLWFSQRAQITPELAAHARLMLMIPDIGFGVFYGLAAIGALMILVRCFIVVMKLRKDLDTELLIPPSTEDNDE